VTTEIVGRRAKTGPRRIPAPANWRSASFLARWALTALLVPAPPEEVHADQATEGPSMEVTISALGDASYGATVGPYEDALRKIGRFDDERVASSNHTCQMVEFNISPPTDGYTDNYGWAIYTFDPLGVTVYLSGTSVVAQCVNGSCINEQTSFYDADGNRHVENHVGTWMSLQIGGPGLHRYLNALRHLQALCGGTRRNPFD